MKFAVFLAQALLFQLVVGQHANFEELDPNDEMNEEEFEKYFNKLPPKDPEEYKRRESALKKNEEEVKEANKKFIKGEITWFDGINEFSNLPEDEFKKEKTGYNAEDLNITEGRGLLKPSPDMIVHADSERYFASVMLNRGNAPRSYSSVDYGYVTDVRNQESCGSCVAFATAAALEVCFAKLLRKKTDVSEQNFLDCGYEQDSANGCRGATLYSYGKTWADNKLSLAHEAQYPYNATVNQCNNVPKYKFGAEIVENYHTYRGTEELMKELVYKHGAVTTAVAASGPFQQYRGGIFAGCTSQKKDHAVTVVGYGEENGIPYWLIKNSWGTRVGEKGYWRLKRGVNMCGIGTDISIPICSRVAGPTDAPMKVEKPCKDGSAQCPAYAKYCDQGNIKEICKKTCGTCEKPCKDGDDTCPYYTKYCYQPAIKEICKKTCGACGGNTGGNTESKCKDKYTNCAKYKNMCTSNAQVKAGCPVTCGTCGGNATPDECFLEDVGIKVSLKTIVYNSGKYSQAKCLSACVADSNCYEYMSRTTGACYIRKISFAAGGGYTMPDIMNKKCLLKKECGKMELPVYGFYTLRTLTTADAKECHALCAKTDNCKFWTWKNKTCEFKADNYKYKSSYWFFGSRFC